jgi:hypothetical protein
MIVNYALVDASAVINNGTSDNEVEAAEQGIDGEAWMVINNALVDASVAINNVTSDTTTFAQMEVLAAAQQKDSTSYV